MAIHRQLTLCRRLRSLREGKGLTQNDVAEILGMSQAAFCRLERGEIQFNLSRLLALSELYEVRLATLLQDL